MILIHVNDLCLKSSGLTIHVASFALLALREKAGAAVDTCVLWQTILRIKSASPTVDPFKFCLLPKEDKFGFKTGFDSHGNLTAVLRDSDTCRHTSSVIKVLSVPVWTAALLSEEDPTLEPTPVATWELI